MLRIGALLLAALFLVGCGGGTMPVTPPHSGSTGGTGTGSGSTGTGSGTGTSSGSSGSGTSSSGSSGSGSGTSSSGGTGSSGTGTSGSGSSGTGSSGTGTSGSGTSGTGSSGTGTSSSGSSGTGSSGSGTSGSGSSGTGSSGSGTSGSGSSGSGSSGSGSSGGTPSGTVGPSSFTFSGYDWHTDTGSAPPVGNKNGNVGIFETKNVTVGSELVLALTQTQNGSQILSSGAEVITTQKFGYGTFEFTSRVAGVYSGSITTGFLYATNSETEIDMEQVGNKPDAVDCTNWHGVSNFQDTQVFGYDMANSHDFKIVWQPSFVDWYVDGTLVVHHTQAVPSAPAPFLFSAWGTNSSSWGGLATIGPTRYMYVSSFKYTP